MRTYQLLTSVLAITFLAGCAAKPIIPQAQSIEIVNEQPDLEKCKFLGEIFGSQGNWITGDFTSNKDLMLGARNELRNEAFKLGGNVVYMQSLQSSGGFESLGTTNTTAVGKAYNCSK
ncbi:hypothetical protein CS022_10490 [Veronia nyctiphanis]|uniref:DUF4156 domain-containing protein n=1 Tax=Veronia nyctiphanis TaxID=1278244 RepID=A0A4Q0YW04_9GAMM|nr:DUF4156 domain-containing protein [Veronia nyctiphanis]RXJ73181.1 hypothetical protein CS022_10490 [Veronia nyctiphanis]